MLEKQIFEIKTFSVRPTRLPSIIPDKKSPVKRSQVTEEELMLILENEML